MEGKGGTGPILYKYFVESENSLDLTRVIPQLVLRQVFTLQDEIDIRSYHSHNDQVKAFVDILASKQLEGILKCSDVFEKTHPKLLTAFVAEYQGE